MAAATSLATSALATSARVGQLVLCNTQSELHPLEEGKHAADSKMDLKAYAEKAGKKYDMLARKARAFRVVSVCNVANATERDDWMVFYEIGAAPEWLWSALVEQMLTEQWTVAKTREKVATFKDIGKGALPINQCDIGLVKFRNGTRHLATRARGDARNVGSNHSRCRFRMSAYFRSNSARRWRFTRVALPRRARSDRTSASSGALSAALAFSRFRADCARPSVVFGPVLSPPWNLHRPFDNALHRQDVPRLVFAPHSVFFRISKPDQCWMAHHVLHFSM